MAEKEMEVAQLRTNIRLNNRLRLEFHASLSRLLREHGLKISDDRLSQLTLATPRELMGLAGTDVDVKYTRMRGAGPDGSGVPPAGEEGAPPEGHEEGAPPEGLEGATHRRGVEEGPRGVPPARPLENR